MESDLRHPRTPHLGAPVGGEGGRTQIFDLSLQVWLCGQIHALREEGAMVVQ